MSKTTEKLENLKCTDDKEDVGDEHCYVHTCPTQSCTEVLRSLHSAKLQLECEVIKLQSELRCIKMHLEQKASLQINGKEVLEIGNHKTAVSNYVFSIFSVHQCISSKYNTIYKYRQTIG